MNAPLKTTRIGILTFLCPALCILLTGCEPPNEKVELQDVLTNLMSGRVVALEGNSEDLDTWADGYETYVQELFPDVPSESAQVLAAVNGSLMAENQSSDDTQIDPADLTQLGLYAVGSEGTQEMSGIRADGTFEMQIPQNESYRFGLIHLDTGEELGELQLGGAPGAALPAYNGDHDFGEVLLITGSLIPTHPPIGPIQTEAIQKKKGEKGDCSQGHDGPLGEGPGLSDSEANNDLQE